MGLGALFLLIATSRVGGFAFALPVCGLCLVCWLGFAGDGRFSNFTKWGDFSYGIYVYAFPVQQALIASWGAPMSPVVNFALALPITLVLAVLSWHLIEKGAMQLKRGARRVHSESAAVVATPATL